MFSKSIIDSDIFLDMPLSAQALYFHLSMRADDDGFINNPKKIQRIVGASDDDCKLLIAKRFVITFESGVIVIKHWKIHNYIQKDRYKETLYKDEKRSLILDENKAYTECIQSVSNLETQVRLELGKDRLELGKDSLEGERELESKPKRKRFVRPTLEEVKAYCLDKGYSIDAERFINYYESVDWKRGKTPIKDWKATVRTWESKNKHNNMPTNKNNNSGNYTHGVEGEQPKGQIWQDV